MSEKPFGSTAMEAENVCERRDHRQEGAERMTVRVHPIVVCLCGSTRFRDELIEANRHKMRYCHEHGYAGK